MPSARRVPRLLALLKKTRQRNRTFSRASCHRFFSSSTARNSVAGRCGVFTQKSREWNGRSLSCWPPKGAASTSPSWAPGIKNLGSFFIRHSYPDVTDNGAGRGYALFADIPKMSVRGRGKAVGFRVLGGFAVCRPQPGVRPAKARPFLRANERACGNENYSTLRRLILVGNSGGSGKGGSISQ